MANIPEEVEPTEFVGTSGADIIYDVSNFVYWGLGGNDIFFAHENDAVWNGAWYVHYDDTFHGGMGEDTVSYVLSEKRITANLEAGVAYRLLNNGQVLSADDFSGIENLMGSVYSDSIAGSDGANKLWGHGGNDSIWAQGGNDQAWGDSGNDTVNGGVGSDQIGGGTGNDALNGDSGNDDLRGDDGADTLNGGSGDDRLAGGAHNDALDGGSGTDTVVYTGNGAVTVNLWLGTASGAQGNDSIVNVERVETGNGSDVVYGSEGANRITTGGGGDVVYAFGGHDWVEAGTGNDQVHGYAGDDVVFGGAGADRIWGGDGNDGLHGDAGNDRISGDAGDDELWGGGNDDLLRGGAGADTIVTGSGADVLRWEAGDDGLDLVTDFDLAADRFSFKPGFFAVEPVGATDLEDVLAAWNAGGGDTLLAANTASDGWQFIAKLENVNAILLSNMIGDESILAVQVAGLGVGNPDGFDFG